MKILVLGAGGMAGHMIALRLSELGHDVVGIARRRLEFCKSIVLDITNENELKRIIEHEKFDAVINAVGILPGSIEKDPANGIWINSYFPHSLSKMTECLSTRIIHLSTDCVFSGQSDCAYRESAIQDSQTLYGKSKLLGELTDNKNLTFRTSIIGPDINENGRGLFHWFMRQSGQVNGYTQAIWSGVSTLTLAEAIAAALLQNLTGLYQLTNNEPISKYQLLGMFNRLRSVPVKIEKDDSVAINRSLYCTRTDFDFRVPGYEYMIEEIGKWILSHKEYYPYYEMEAED